MPFQSFPKPGGKIPLPVFINTMTALAACHAVLWMCKAVDHGSQLLQTKK
jgi:hypothetical protein